MEDLFMVMPLEELRERLRIKQQFNSSPEPTWETQQTPIFRYGTELPPTWPVDLKKWVSRVPANRVNASAFAYDMGWVVSGGAQRTITNELLRTHRLMYST